MLQLRCILLLCAASAASSSRQARRELDLEEFLPGAMTRAAKAVPFAMASMMPGAPESQQVGRSDSPIMRWDYQPWLPAQGFSGPSVLLGGEMGPFSGGRRILSRYAGHALPEQSRSILIEKDAGSYAALFNEDTKTSDAVYYTVDPENFQIGAGRGRGWASSEDLKEFEKQDEEFVAPHAKDSYLGVGHIDLDRGHQAPVAAFNGDMGTAQSTNQAENLTPQNAKLNQGNWKMLEEAERHLASSEDKELHILTGPLFKLPQDAIEDSADDWEELLQRWCGAGLDASCDHSVGLRSSQLNDVELRFKGKQEEDGIRIPLGYFKVIADPEDKAVAGFVMDQTGSWWPMAGLPGVESAGPEALDLAALELPDEFHTYDPEKSADLAVQLSEKLKEEAEPRPQAARRGKG